MKKVITYGTFDLIHHGHINILRRAKAMGDYLIVALSTDEFTAGKGKQTYYTYEERKLILVKARERKEKTERAFKKRLFWEKNSGKS